MSDVTARAIRASDTERDKAAALLQRQFAEGRLTRAELEERVAAAYSARTREQLRALTADLAAAQWQPARSGEQLRVLPAAGQPAQPGPDMCLLILLLVVFPPAGLAYWLMSRCGSRAPAARGRLS